MTIGFIGLGAMGGGIAAQLLSSGHPLLIHDLDRAAAKALTAKGAVWSESPAELAAQSEVVFTSLPRPDDVEAICEQISDALPPGSTWFDLSTNAPEVVTRIHERLSERGVFFCDAPVSGGPAGAASGKLAIWVGGDQKAFIRHQPILNQIADRARYIGPSGSGTIAKLVHNTMAATINHAVAEMMTVGVKAGMDPLALYEAIRSGAMGRMRAFDNVHPRWLAGNTDTPTFALELLHKDVALGVALAEKVGAPAPLATRACHDLEEALDRGWGRRDAQAALILSQERAGIDPISAPIEAIKEVMERS